jgi:hypothetical protein
MCAMNFAFKGIFLAYRLHGLGADRIIISRQHGPVPGFYDDLLADHPRPQKLIPFTSARY